MKEKDFYLLADRHDKYYGGVPEEIIWTNRFEAKMFYDRSNAEQEMHLVNLKGSPVGITLGPSPTEIYHKYIDLVRYITHRMNLSDQVEDAESYLGLLIMTGWDRYDVRVCRRTTWLGRMLSGYLLDEKIKRAKNRLRCEYLKGHYIHRPEDTSFESSIEAQTIIRMIREDPEGCRKQFNRSNRLKKLVNHMQNQGWSREKVDLVLEELKEML